MRPPDPPLVSADRGALQGTERRPANQPELRGNDPFRMPNAMSQKSYIAL